MTMLVAEYDDSRGPAYTPPTDLLVRPRSMTRARGVLVGEAHARGLRTHIWRADGQRR